MSLDAALAYAARGWPVVPLWWPTSSGLCACRRPDCDSAAKHPIPALVPHGAKDATTDPDTTRRWRGRYPHANVGVVVGPASGIVVLDVDPRHDGDERLAALEAQHGALPATVEVATGGGGRHLYFKYPAGGVRSRALAKEGLELKASGYVVAPPSVHRSGKPYTWDLPGDVDPAPFAELPRWLVELAGRG